MPSFAVEGYELGLYNKRNTVGALRSVRLWGRRGAAQYQVTLWFLAGEPLPRVDATVEFHWEATFPIMHYEAVVDMLRNESPVWLMIAVPDHVALMTGKEPVGENEEA